MFLRRVGGHCSRPIPLRPVLYLGEINDSQRAAWCHSIEVFEPGNGERRQGGAVSGGSGSTGAGSGGGTPSPGPVAGEVTSPVGRVLAGLRVMAAVAVGRVLGTAVAAESRGDRLAGHPEDAGQLPTD